MSSPLKRSKRFRVGLAVALAAGAVAVPAAVLACTEPAGGHRHFSIPERTRLADVVLVGLVLTTTNSGRGGNFMASVQVSETIKGGPLADVVRIAGFGSSTLCLNYVNEGQGWLFFASHVSGGDLRARYFSASDAIEPLSDANIAAARAAVPGTLDPPAPTPTPIATPSPIYRLWVPYSSAAAF